MTYFRILALASAALILATPALAAPPNSSITGKDASAATVTLGAVSDGTLKSPSHSLVDTTGAAVNPASSDLQTTGNTSLSTIATNSGTQATAANQTSVIGTKAAGTAAASSMLIGGVYNTSAPTLTTGQQAAMQFDSSGNLKINVVAGGAGGGAITAASGSYAAGAFAVGSGTDGWDVTLGTKADAATCATTNTAMACFRQLHSDVTGPIPAGTNVIGHVIIDSGSTTAVTSLPALPAGTNTLGATYSFQGSSGNTLPAASDSSAFLNMTTATTTQIVALSSAKKIYVGAYDLNANGTTTAKLVYGTGTNCGTGTTDITSTLNLTAQAGIARGNGLGALLTVPASNALCVVNSAAVNLQADVSYAQF